MRQMTPTPTTLIVDGVELQFECTQDIVDAFKEIKSVLLKSNEKSKESKRRGSRFLLAVISAGIVKDPGNKVKEYCNKVLS